MAQSTITVPESLTNAVEEGLGKVDLPRWALEAMVLEALREGLITRGYGGEILGLGFHEREAFYAQRGVVYDYSDEDLAQERRDLERMLGAK